MLASGVALAINLSPNLHEIARTHAAVRGAPRQAHVQAQQAAQAQAQLNLQAQACVSAGLPLAMPGYSQVGARRAVAMVWAARKLPILSGSDMRPRRKEEHATLCRYSAAHSFLVLQSVQTGTAAAASVAVHGADRGSVQAGAARPCSLQRLLRHACMLPASHGRLGP